jgi:hypothetical protein|tara:strand:- start:43 stop:735 length:693 start_codon:yes stop_codon:yes gene_type:complete
MKFYQKLDLENLDKIQQEVLEYWENNPPKLEEHREVFLKLTQGDLPITCSILNKRTLIPINEISTCFVPAGMSTGAHMDGIKTKTDISEERMQRWISYVSERTNLSSRNVDDDHFFCNQWSFVIPIKDCEDSVNCWYYNEDVTDDNRWISRNVRKEWPYEYDVCFVTNPQELRTQCTTVLDYPTIIKSNVYHNVDNTKNKNTRIVLVVRFIEHKDHMEADDYFNCEGIKV